MSESDGLDTKARAWVNYTAEHSTLEERLVAYAILIEGRWRGLSDGERLRLMALCCRECGAIAGKCDCPSPFDATLPWRCPRCKLRYTAGSDSTVAHRTRGEQLCILCTEACR